MNELQIMNVGGIDCYEKDGIAYLKLETVARGLGFTQIAKSGNESVRWERVYKYLQEFGIPTSGDEGYIPENVFYRLAMKAKNPAAEAFQAKVADEIIPSIRKTGGYISGQETMSDAELMAKALLVAQRQIDERNHMIERMKPKEIFADAVSASHTSILMGDMAKLLKQNGIDVGQKRLFEWMREHGYLIKQRGGSWNLPTQRSMEQQLFEVKETAVTHSDGHISISKTVKVTGKGQIYFINKFLGKENAESKRISS